jgi:hypothetical protein
MALAPLAVPLVRPVLAAGPENAVDAYREALGKVPTLTDDDKNRLNDVAGMPLDGIATDLVGRAAPALELLAAGASRPSCDWGDTWVGDGFEHVTDWIMQARPLARLSMLRARLAFESGRATAGIDQAIAVLRFARHLGQGGVMIAQLIGMAIEHETIAAVAVPLPRLDRVALRTLDTRFLDLPAIPDISSTVRAEKAFFLGYVVSHDPKEAAKLGPLTPWYDRLIAACTDPTALDAMRSESKSDAEKTQFFDSFDGHRRARVYADVKRALLRAAIAVASHGTGAIDRIPDPFDGRPFGLRTWSTGFELTSRFALEKKPNAALIVGKRA